MLTLKIKRLSEDAILPVQSTPGAGCWDVFASSPPTVVSSEELVLDKGEVFNSFRYLEYQTGLSFELPDGYDMLIFPRSSISNTDLFLANGVGYLDNDYRGELRFRFRTLQPDKILKNFYGKGERIGQIRLIERNEFDILEVDSLSETKRGDGGFGSTGK